MNSYQLGRVEPTLNDTERLMYDLVCNLSTAQTRHRFHDPTAPPPLDVSGIEDIEDIKSATQAWSEAWLNQMKERGPVDPKPYASLEALWPLIVPPGSLSAVRTSGDDLVFKDFALCQRYVDEKRSPVGWIARYYVVGIPIGTQTCRCVVQEASGRTLCTTASCSQCLPPARDDFQIVRVAGTGVDFKTGERGPTIMQLYLPGCYGNWSIIKDNKDEEIIGNGKT